MFHCIVLAFGGLFLFSFSLLTQSNQISVDTDGITNPIRATVYGNYIEEVNHEIYGSLYNQEIIGERFVEPASGYTFSPYSYTIL